MERLIRLAPSAALKERRLREARGDAFDRDPGLARAVREAQARGSLGLSGIEPTEDALAILARAQDAVEPPAPFGVKALLAWHGALVGRPSAFRTAERTRDDGPAPAPPAFVASRLATLEEWLAAESARELGPGPAGALVLARVTEVQPFDEANGRVARLAASHVVVRAGGRPPVFVPADAERLAAAIAAAYALQTEPLARLIDEASERALDAMIEALTR